MAADHGAVVHAFTGARSLTGVALLVDALVVLALLLLLTDAGVTRARRGTGVARVTGTAGRLLARARRGGALLLT
ncbi:hypothetical protein, partial [Streptomyces heilongjiangensis]